MTLVFETVSDILLQKYTCFKKNPHSILFSLFFCFLLITAFDDPLWIFKGCVFIQTLIAISYLDIKTRKIPDSLLLPIVLCGFIHIHITASIAGAIVIPLVMLLLSIKSDGIGGGDIKLTAACGWVLGIWMLTHAVIIALSLSIISYFVFRWNRKAGYPMAPYIALGCSIAFFIQ